jgi:hypothetical protein
MAILVAVAQTKPRNLTQMVMLSPKRSRALTWGLWVKSGIRE